MNLMKKLYRNFILYYILNTKLINCYKKSMKKLFT